MTIVKKLEHFLTQIYVIGTYYLKDIAHYNNYLPLVFFILLI